MTEAYGARRPRWLDRTVIAATSRLPDNWLGPRLAILLRRIVTMRLAGDCALDVERWGLRMRLFPLRNGCEKGLLFTPQMYEVPERAELAADIDRARAAGRGFVFVDIGANVGLFSLFVAARAGPAATIIAIEPEPGNLGRLRFNVAANPEIPVRVVPVALGETEGSVALDVDLRDRGGTRTRPLRGSDASTDTPQVECRTLLDVVRKENVPAIDALKIDVEGAEDTVLMPFLRDAPDTLWPRLMIAEASGDLSQSAVFTRLLSLGYEIAARSKQNVMMRR
jgi:FkbM family methyltransferase